MTTTTLRRSTIRRTTTKVLDKAEGVAQAIVSVSGNLDSDGDVVVPGASAAGLARLWPKGVWHHDWTTPVARTIAAEEVYPGDPSLPGDLLAAGYGGLRVTGQYNLATDAGREAFANVDFFAEEQEYSVGYAIEAALRPASDADAILAVLSAMALCPHGDTAQAKGLVARMHKRLADERDDVDAADARQWITDWTVYEWSPVLFGANPLTRTESAKALADVEHGLAKVVGALERIVVRLDEKAAPDPDPDPDPDPVADDGDKGDEATLVEQRLADAEEAIAYLAAALDEKGGDVQRDRLAPRLDTLANAADRLASARLVGEKGDEADEDPAGAPPGDDGDEPPADPPDGGDGDEDTGGDEPTAGTSTLTWAEVAESEAAAALYG